MLLGPCCTVDGCPVFNDTFNRADGDPGSNWTVSDASVAISSNKLLIPAGETAECAATDAFQARYIKIVADDDFEIESKQSGTESIRFDFTNNELKMVYTVTTLSQVLDSGTLVAGTSSTIEIYSASASEITVVIDGVEIITDQLFATVFGDSVITAVKDVNIDEFDIKKINVTDCPVHNRQCTGCCENYDTSDDFDIEVGLWNPTVSNDPATFCLKIYWDGSGPAIWLYFFLDGDKDDASPTNRQCRMRVFISADERQWDNYNADNYDFGGVAGAYYEGAAFTDSDCDGRYPETLNLIDYNGTPPGEIGGFSWPATLVVSEP